MCKLFKKFVILHFVNALVVQWIERRFPKPEIWVRFPAGVLIKPCKLLIYNDNQSL